ncbi:DUF2752 domain-containing protein [Pedobacter sp. N23S346]|uniref:DUF2752 domain-containing protein n=1 Tax=Pedobacter sp. N23S346 TaxID=3402750 RepID=UPI003AD519FC
MEVRSSFLDWLSHHLFTCPFKSHFGIDCPGCGFQRSLIALLKGNILESFKLYPATIPFLFVVIFMFVHLRYDFRFGAQIIKITVATIAVIILINYIYKIYTHQLII